MNKIKANCYLESISIDTIRTKRCTPLQCAKRCLQLFACNGFNIRKTLGGCICEFKGSESWLSFTCIEELGAEVWMDTSFPKFFPIAWKVVGHNLHYLTYSTKTCEVTKLLLFVGYCAFVFRYNRINKSSLTWKWKNWIKHAILPCHVFCYLVLPGDHLSSSQKDVFWEERATAFSPITLN